MNLAIQMLDQRSLYFNARLHALSAVLNGILPINTPVGKGRLHNGQFYTLWVATEKDNPYQPQRSKDGTKNVLRLGIDGTNHSMYVHVDVFKLIEVANGRLPHTQPFGSVRVPGTRRWATAFIVTDDKGVPKRNGQGHFRMRLKLQQPQA